MTSSAQGQEKAQEAATPANAEPINNEVLDNSEIKANGGISLSESPRENGRTNTTVNSHKEEGKLAVPPSPHSSSSDVAAKDKPQEAKDEAPQRSSLKIGLIMLSLCVSARRLLSRCNIAADLVIPDGRLSRRT